MRGGERERERLDCWLIRARSTPSIEDISASRMNYGAPAGHRNSRHADFSDSPKARSRDNLLMCDDFGEENCCSGRCLGYVHLASPQRLGAFSNLSLILLLWLLDGLFTHVTRSSLFKVQCRLKNIRLEMLPLNSKMSVKCFVFFKESL